MDTGKQADRLLEWAVNSNPVDQQALRWKLTRVQQLLAKKVIEEGQVAGVKPSQVHSSAAEKLRRMQKMMRYLDMNNQPNVAP